METVKGTTKKQNPMDQPMKCRGCGRMFYSPYVDRKWVECCFLQALFAGSCKTFL